MEKKVQVIPPGSPSKAAMVSSKGTPSLPIGHPDQCNLESKNRANEPLLRCSMLVLPLQLSREKEKDITKVGVVNAQPVYRSPMEVENDEAL
jgi:hypothetical protein